MSSLQVRGSQRRSPSALMLFLAVMLACFLTMTLVAPATALAGYSIDKVDIDAAVRADGSVQVTERRTYSFDDSYNGVYWKIPTGATSDGRMIQTTIDSVSVVPESDSGAGGEACFERVQNAANGMDGVYETSDDGSNIEVKLYHPVDDETVTYQIVYTDTNLAARYQDVSELYWKFVSDGWDVESQNVTCAIHLPVPAGATFTHDGSDDAGVRAWGHGPLDATVSIADDGTVTYKVPGVGTSEYAEARIVFPQEWLPAATQQQGSILPTVLDEEQKWADEANAQRDRARLMMGLAVGGVIAAAAASIIGALVLRHRYRVTHAPHFDDKYFRDVPSDDHPAVLGALLRDGTPSTDDLTASLMRLTDEGYARLEKVSVAKGGAFGRTRHHDEYRLTRTDKSLEDEQKNPAAKIDRATLSFVFDGLAPLSDHPRQTGGGDEDAGGKGPDELWISDIGDIAHREPERYAKLYEDWSDEVSAACIGRRFFIDDREIPRWPLGLLGTIDALACIAAFMMLSRWGAPASAFVISFLACFVGIFAVVLGRGGMKDRSSEAIELTAELEALRRWLKDFTRLKEAVPSDVALWDRLLVMAVVLGVSKEVIKQLEVAAPQVLSDPGLMPVYCWYGFGPRVGGPSPFDQLGDAAAEAHQVSQAALAKSSMSSAGGGGGGFSAGGGGGFGGGGGGGAF